MFRYRWLYRDSQLFSASGVFTDKQKSSTTSTLLLFPQWRQMFKKVSYLELVISHRKFWAPIKSCFYFQNIYSLAYFPTTVMNRTILGKKKKIENEFSFKLSPWEKKKKKAT